MTTRYIKPGDAIDYTAVNAIAVNTIVVLGALIGIAASNIAAGTTGTLLVNGVHTLPKKAGTVIPAGTKVTWSVADNAMIVGAGVKGDVANCGVVVELDAAAGDTAARVYIAPGMGTAVSA
ncbi:MAG: capsid cement protein [Rhodanobacter sp.]